MQLAEGKKISMHSRVLLKLFGSTNGGLTEDR